MKYGNICIFSVKDKVFLPRQAFTALAAKYRISGAIIPRESSAADAFRLAARDYNAILSAGKCPIKIHTADKNGLLIRRIIQRSTGRDKTLAKLWLKDCEVHYRAATHCKTDPYSLIDRFKELYALRLQNIGKRHLQKLITDYLIRYTKAVKISGYGSVYFVPADYTLQIKLLRNFAQDVNQESVSAISILCLDVVSVSEELQEVLTNSLEQEVWACSQTLRDLIRCDRPSRAIAARRLNETDALLQRIEAYHGICGSDFTDRQLALLMDQAAVLERITRPWDNLAA